MSLIGPLTTTFTAPSGACATSRGIHIVRCDPQIPNDGCLWWAEGPLLPDGASCYPEGFNPTRTMPHYSPGVCPSGYTPACTSRVTVAPLTETIHTCCPAALGYTYQCLPTPLYTWQTFLPCTISLSGSTLLSFPSATFIDGGRTMMTSTARTEVGIGAYGIEVRYQAKDVASETTTTSSPPPPEPTGPGSPSPEPTGLTDPGGSASAAGGASLSTGAIAGIAVGAVILGISLLGVGFWWWRRKRSSTISQGPETMSPYKISDLKQTPRQPHELHGFHGHSEMPNSHGRAELD